jgi:Lantibiotic dehydratase, N terminus
VDDLASVAGEWELWRSFAVRSAGFPVSGLEAFGPGDESDRLREVARDPFFREAVTWQNSAAVGNAVVKVADGSSRKPSRARQREEIVASYWQRYCAKTDTIGFFGPLAWGRIDDGPPLHARSSALVRERSVHLESWGVQALAESVDPELKVGSGPWTERDLRVVLEAHPDDAVRRRGLAALARLEAARDAVDASPRESLAAALAALDATFVELTGREAFRNPGKAYGARTLAYVDCLRDLDVTVGPGLVADLAPALQTLFEACRWYCGQVNEIGRRVIERSLPAGGRGPFVPLLVEVLRTLMQLPPEIGEVVVELQQRFESVLSDPDPATIGARSVAAFADHRPAWRFAAFQSVDVQIAAPDAEAVAAGRHLAVIGDVHPGNNPLIQGVFAHRHPDPDAFLRAVGAAIGPRMPVLLPPWGPGISVDARGVGVTPLDAVNIAASPDTRAQLPRRTWLPPELLVEGADLVDRAGTLRVSLLDAFALPIFVAGVRSFELLPDQLHAPRVSIGRTVLQRESWHVPAADVPEHAQDVAGFARDRGMPRRVFTKSPLERKPMYLDVESQVLARILCRQARQAAAESPAARIRFTEMLPTPEACWLADPDGNRYVSELRLVAVDRHVR